MDKKEYLLTDSFNWADEMDLSGFVIVTEYDIEILKKYLESRKGETEYFFIGTNEEVDCEVDEYLSELENIKPLVNEESKTIRNLIGDSIGNTLWERWLDLAECEYGRDPDKNNNDIETDVSDDEPDFYYRHHDRLLSELDDLPLTEDSPGLHISRLSSEISYDLIEICNHLALFTREVPEDDMNEAYKDLNTYMVANSRPSMSPWFTNYRERVFDVIFKTPKNMNNEYWKDKIKSADSRHIVSYVPMPMNALPEIDDPNDAYHFCKKIKSHDYRFLDRKVTLEEYIKESKCGFRSWRSR